MRDAMSTSTSPDVTPTTAASVPWLRRRYTVEVRQAPGAGLQVLALSLALLTGVLLSAAILIAAGVSAQDLVEEFLVATLFDADSLHAVLFQAAPMMMVGLAAAIAFRARFWNLGLEGQMVCGAIAATFVSLHQVGPPGARLVVMGLAALVGGLAWVVVPLWLKQRLKVNELISTLMLNYVAGNLLLHLVYGDWKDPKDGFPHSPAYAPAERLPEIGGVSSAVLLAVVFGVLAWWLMERSRAGLYLRFINASTSVARALGVPVVAMTLASVLTSGALAGFGGFMVTAGQEGRLTQAFYTGYGFSGILIAFLARNHPIAAVVVAFLVAMLFVAGRNLQVFYQIPFSMVQLIQSLLVISVAAADFFINYRLARVARES